MKKTLIIILSIILSASLALATPPAAPSSGGVSSSAGVVALFGSGSCSGLLYSDGTCKDIGTDVQAYNQYYMKKSSAAITTGHLVKTDSNGDLVGAGAPTTINAGNSTLLCKDSAGEVEACGGVTISGTTSPIVNINPQEVDGHTTSTNLTAAQVSNTIITNYDQAASDVFLILPTAAAGYSFLMNVATAQSKHFCVEAGASDKIYLIAAAGTIAAGDDGAAACFVAAQVGQQAACWTFKTGASSYDWACKAIAIGTSTFEAHASSE